MNQPELDSILKRARLPDIPSESQELFARKVVSRLKQNPPPVNSARINPLSFLWAIGLSACLVLAIMISFRNQPLKSGSLSTSDTLADIKVIQETLALFPNQVRAIVENDQGLNLILSEKEDIPVSAPIYVHICDGRNCSSFVTFSGQDIPVEGQAVTVLVDARGEIILAGQQFVWSNADRIQAGNHLKIEAKLLATTTL